MYHPELQKLGYQIDVLDSFVPGATFSHLNEVKGAYDIAVICTPNYTHLEYAAYFASKGTAHIFVEKPGVSKASEWASLCGLTNSKFHLVKNNLYRDNYGSIIPIMDTGEVIGVDINWLNGNRIPNPGGWFTNSKYALKGVSGDLMPHLYCFALKIFGEDALLSAKFKQQCFQRWSLENIINTDYGTVFSDGVYNVDDYATARATVNGIPLKMTASWKEGYDKQSITLYLENGSTHEWTFGLCPAEAYGKMLQDLSDTTVIDTAMHNFLEGFKIED